MKQVKEKMDLFYLHVVIYLVITFGIGFIPPIAEITPMGMKVIGVFAGLIYSWTMLGFTFPSLFSMIALGFSGYDTPLNVIISGIGNPNVIFVMFNLTFVAYCNVSGLNSVLGKYIMSRPFFVGHPWIFTITVLLGTFLVTTLVSTGLVFVIVGILYMIFHDIGYQKGDDYPAYLLAGCYIVSVFSFMCAPWRGQILLGLSALSSVSNGTFSISYLKVLAFGLPLAVLSIIFFTLALRFVFKPDVTPLLRLTHKQLDEIRATIKIETEQKIALVAVGVFVVLMLLPGVLPQTTAIGVFFSNFSMAAGIGVILAVLSIIRVNNKPVFDFVDCARKGINWEMVLMIGVCLPASAALSSDAAGVNALLTNLLMRLLDGNNTIVFLAIFTIVAVIATQFTHNVTIVLVGVPILWNVCQNTGLDATISMMLLFMASSIACATPAASTFGALPFAETEWIGVKRAFHAGITSTVLATVILLAIGLPLIVILL